METFQGGKKSTLLTLGLTCWKVSCELLLLPETNQLTKSGAQMDLWIEDQRKQAACLVVHFTTVGFVHTTERMDDTTENKWGKSATRW